MTFDALYPFPYLDYFVRANTRALIPRRNPVQLAAHPPWTSAIGPMPRHTCLLIPLLIALFLPGCQGLDGLAQTGEGRSRITISAQSGSEVVLTKNVNGPRSGEDTHASELAALADAGREEALPVQPDAANGHVAPATLPTAARPLGEVRDRPWRVQPGKTLFNAVSRFAERAGRTAQKAERYPVWEITAAAAFSGEFEAALAWLMAGFEHTRPRPVLSIHSNGIVRLDAE